MGRRTLGLAFWISFACAGAASAQETESHNAAESDDVNLAAASPETCFDITRAQDINVMTDEHVYVRTIGGNQYLLTMAQTCRNLQRSYRSGDVRIQPFGRRVCPNDGSHLLYNWSGRESVCPILTIDAVEDREEARAIAEGNASPVQVEEVDVPD